MKTLITTTVLCSAVALAVPAAAQNDASGYCSEGYTAADRDQDDIVTESEAMAARESEFSAMDANQDESISRDEYSACMEGWAASSTVDPATDDDFANLDADDDGMVTAQEYMDVVEETAMSSTDEGTVQATSSDASGSGTATGNSTADDEGRILLLRRLVLVPSGYEHDRIGSMNDEELATRASQRFETTDADGNNRLSTEEWKNAADAHMRNVAQLMDRSFDRMDADKSGDISRQEYRDDGIARWEASRDRAGEDGEDTNAGAPVVYYRYPSTM